MYPLDLRKIFFLNHLPAPTPHIIVAMTGVLVLSLTIDKNSNNRPSQDMAYRIRGIGNRHPNKLYTNAWKRLLQQLRMYYRLKVSVTLRGE